MTRSLGTVKPEIRVLGIDTCGRSGVFGAVTRGGSFLDGAVRFRLGTIDIERELASEVRASRYYPELRVLMIHDSRAVIERKRLEKLVDLPVIKVIGTPNPRRFSLFSHKGRKMHYQSSLPPSINSRIMTVTWRMGSLPEPVRIAHMLARRA